MDDFRFAFIRYYIYLSGRVKEGHCRAWKERSVPYKLDNIHCIVLYILINLIKFPISYEDLKKTKLPYNIDRRRLSGMLPSNE